MTNTIQPRKLGIMGGTFDPIHYGHLLLAQNAAEEFDLDQVFFLPTGKSPHKANSQVTRPDIRCEMVGLAISDNPKFELSMIESQSTDVNYTYLTLQKFHQIYPGTKFYFIMGEDSLDDFKNWKNPKEICRLASLLVAVRNDLGNTIQRKVLHAVNDYSADIHMLHTPNVSISSSEIRKRIQLGKTVQYMLPKEVETFIRMNSLYLG